MTDLKRNMPERITETCDSIKAMLLAKNAAYGNSALDPLRVFSKADTVEQLKVRIDDKLSRIFRGSTAGEDTVRDLIGYLVLLLIAEEAPKPEPTAQKVEKALAKAETIPFSENLAPFDPCRDPRNSVPPAISTAVTQEEVDEMKLLCARLGDAPSTLAKATGLPLRKVNLILKAIGKEA